MTSEAAVVVAAVELDVVLLDKIEKNSQKSPVNRWQPPRPKPNLMYGDISIFKVYLIWNFAHLCS